MSLSKAAKYPRVDSPLIAVVEEASPGHRLSTFTINDLSDDALIHIFEYFPLQTIITSFRQVCTRWNATVGTLCASKRSLKLIYYEQPKLIHLMYSTLFVRNFASWPPEHYNRLRLKPIGYDNDLIIRPKFKAEHCHLFRRLFPQIQNLLIKETGERFLAHLPALLAGWPDLVTFSLHGYLSPKSAKLQEQLYEALGRLSQLRHLDLLCDRLHGFRPNLKVMAPILGQLEHFSARMLNSPLKDTFLGALSANCTSLHFKEFPKVHLLASYLKPELFQSVTHLGFTKMQLTQEQVNFISDHFVNCTDLTLEWEDKLIYMQLPLVDIVRPLCKLTRLSVLRLKFEYSKLSDFYEALPDSQPLPSSSCPSVRQLTIRVDSFVSTEHQVHTRPLYVFLSKAFPNLEDLTVYWTEAFGDGNKTPAHYAAEREGRPEVTEYTKNLWRQPLRSFSIKEPTDHFGRFKDRYINRNNRP